VTTPQKPRRRPKVQKVDTFRWLAAAQTAELGARITAAGAGAWLEVREDDKGGLHFRVAVKLPEGVTTLDNGTDINDSRVCPPICPH
jgi:hypothetical protein